MCKIKQCGGLNIPVVETKFPGKCVKITNKTTGIPAEMKEKRVKIRQITPKNGSKYAENQTNFPQKRRKIR